MNELFLSCANFSNIAGITRQKGHRALSRAFKGHTWNKNSLIVDQISGRGGNSGKSFVVLLSSLPQELQDKYNASNLPAVPESSPQEIKWIGGEAYWRYEVIKPALSHPKGSSDRANAIKSISSINRAQASGLMRFNSARTIQGWIKDYETSKLNGLGSKTRIDKGKRKTFVSRVWDKSVPFDDETKAHVASELDKAIRAHWGNTLHLGRKKISRFASHDLRKLTISSGFKADDNFLKKICAIPMNVIHRGRECRKVAIYDMDRKQWHDNKPRIIRHRDNTVPMEVVVGDVHHLDILLHRPDGSSYTPKIIAWQDWSNNRIFVYPVFLPKGRMVRRADVADAYIAMVSHPEWGMPQNLYLDNGGEYNTWTEFVNDAQRLNTKSRSTEFSFGSPEKSSITKAMPYNAAAKAIEGIFGVLERGELSLIEGHIGGDRMSKPTRNLGKAPVHYSGDIETFRKNLATAIEHFETSPQDGALGGLSPRAAYNSSVENGWKRMDIDTLALKSAFAIDVSRKVKKGHVSYDNKEFTSKELQKLTGQYITLKIPLSGELDQLPVMDEQGKFLCVVSPSPTFSWNDISGAKESQKMEQRDKVGIKDLRKTMGKKPDYMKDMREINSLEASALIPESEGRIEMNSELVKIGRVIKDTPKQRQISNNEIIKEQHKRQMEAMNKHSEIIAQRERQAV